MEMSFDPKQQSVTSSQPVLGNHYSNRLHAIKDDLESFKAFLILLTHHYSDRVEIPLTVIKLLHMYHPQDGCDAYMKLLKVICVLLAELNKDILKYLLSIIPPPDLSGSYDLNAMKEEVRKITGFTLLPAPAFHTWVLPVLKNTSNNTEHNRAENEPVNALEDSKQEPEPIVNESSAGTADDVKVRTSVNSDEESVTSEPKLENYDIYEIVGDLSKTLLNQLSSKPDYNLSAIRRMRKLFDLEAIMAPSALKSSASAGQHSSKGADSTLGFDGLTIDPVLEKSMKNFIARAYGLQPSIQSGDSANDQQGNNISETDVNNKKKADTNAKVKCTKQTKRKKTLLDELTRPQKKSLMSYLITPLDPIADSAEVNKDLSSSNNEENSKTESKQSVSDAKKKKKLPLKKDLQDCTDGCSSKQEINGTQNQPPNASDVSTSQVVDGSLPATIVTHSDDEINVTENEDTVSFSTCNEKSAVLTEKEEAKPTETNTLTAVKPNNRPSIIDTEILMNFPGKNLGLEWNVENMKLFGINVTDEDICSPKSEVNQQSEISENNELTNPPSSIAASNEGPSVPISHGFSSYKSYTSQEHLSYLHELAVAKCKARAKEDTLCSSGSAGNKGRSPVTEEKKPLSNREMLAKVPKLQPCVKPTGNAQPIMPQTKLCPEYAGGLFKQQQQQQQLQQQQQQQLHQQQQQKQLQLQQQQQLPQLQQQQQQQQNQQQQQQNQQQLQQNQQQLQQQQQLQEQQQQQQQQQQQLQLQIHQNTINMQRQRGLQLGLHADPSHMRHYIQQGGGFPNVSGPGMGNSPMPTSYESPYSPMPMNQDWMIKASSSIQPVPHPSWGAFSHYAQNPAFREMMQQRVRLAQRAAFLQQASSSVNTYINPSQSVMMNNFWGTYPSVRPGLCGRSTDVPTMIPSLPHPLYPVNVPIRQQQRLHAMSQGMLPNLVAPPSTTLQSQPQPQNKRRKLEEIVGRLKEAEKGTDS